MLAWLWVAALAGEPRGVEVESCQVAPGCAVRAGDRVQVKDTAWVVMRVSVVVDRRGCRPDVSVAARVEDGVVRIEAAPVGQPTDATPCRALPLAWGQVLVRLEAGRPWEVVCAGKQDAACGTVSVRLAVAGEVPEGEGERPGARL